MYVGVDVGTGSARAGLFDEAGRLLASHKHDIAMWREAGDIAEQSSDDIWSAVCACVSAVVSEVGANPADVRGVGFDAACSMVVLGPDLAPISVSQSGDPARNVIVWMDHRATAQAARINSTAHPVLDYVGGRISPEMQTPKLLWLKETMPDTYEKAAHFFDLPDFLTWSATGALARSACTVTCKWTYLAHEARWDDSYFTEIGLADLPADGYARIGREIVTPGTALATGLTEAAARQMGLAPGTPVGSGLIDAHAGGIGTVGHDPEASMAYVFGTSACTMATSAKAHKVPGIWGPYYSAMVPGMWLSEGGQSAAGEAIAHVIKSHPASPAAAERARAEGLSLHGLLLRDAERAQGRISEAVDLASSRVIVPDFLGNRAPFADPAATAIWSGLTLSNDHDDLVATYVAAVLGVGYGLRQIIEVQRSHGIEPSSIVVSGGAGESPAVKQLIADATGMPVAGSASSEPVLLGAAMLGAVASGAHDTLAKAMAAMSAIERRFLPEGGRVKQAHDARYRAYCALQGAEHRLRADLADLR